MMSFAICSTKHAQSESRSTGKERDSESGNDYFGARYYASSMGRFLSPDYADMNWGPTPVPDADFDNPQGLNLYSYVHNNPLTLTDPDGHDVRICDNDGHCKTISNDAYKAAQQAQNQGGLDAPSFNEVRNSKDAQGNFAPVAITSTDANGNTVTVGTATYVPDEHPGIDPNVENNMEGLQTLGAANKVVNIAGAATLVEVAGMGAAVAAPEIAGVMSRSNIIFRLAHAMQWRAGHLMLHGTGR